MNLTRKSLRRSTAVFAVAVIGSSVAADAFAATCIPCTHQYLLWRQPRPGDPVQMQSRFNDFGRVMLSPQPLPPGLFRGGNAGVH